MGKTDTIENRSVILILDKPYILRFTFATLFELERGYGTVAELLKKLYGDDPKEKVKAAVDTLAAMGVPGEMFDKYVTAEKFIEVNLKVLQAFSVSFPDLEGEDRECDKQRAAESYDWDTLYYSGRYRLMMPDAEFWDTTPRRFYKLLKLWMETKGYIEREQEIYMGAVVF